MTPKRGVTFRAVLIGVAFIPLNAYLVVQLETVWGIGDPTTMTIFFNAIFCFFLVSRNIKGWIQPLVWWTLFLTVLCFVMICINSIIRRQWVEQERLTYPLVYLPFEMTQAYFFKNRLLWLGFGIAGAINFLNGLNALFPILPKIPLSYNLATHFIERPWNSIQGWPGMPVQANPFIIGLTFLIPLGLLFSCWFFYVIWKLQYIFQELVMDPWLFSTLTVYFVS